MKGVDWLIAPLQFVRISFSLPFFLVFCWWTFDVVWIAGFLCCCVEMSLLFFSFLFLC